MNGRELHEALLATGVYERAKTGRRGYEDPTPFEPFASLDHELRDALDAAAHEITRKADGEAARSSSGSGTGEDSRVRENLPEPDIRRWKIWNRYGQLVVYGPMLAEHGDFVNVVPLDAHSAGTGETERLREAANAVYRVLHGRAGFSALLDEIQARDPDLLTDITVAVARAALAGEVDQ